MEIYLYIAICLLIIVAYDFFFTVISINGAGLITSMISKGIARCFLWMNTKAVNRTILRFSGVAIILALICWWLGALWIGFFLSLLSDHTAVMDASSATAAPTIDKFYFSGYMLSTLGNGDFVPGSSGWKVMTAIFSFSGFIFITTGMTYLISVSSAVLHKRSLALFIANLLYVKDEGDKVQAVIRNGDQLRNMINKHNQNHLAYPIVHYFYSTDETTSLAPNLARIDQLLVDALKNNVDSNTLHPLYHSMNSYLHTVNGTFVKTVGTLSENENDKLADKDIRKALFKDILKSDGWDSDILKTTSG
ncbi:two pore domain potassium channel family protein [Cryomorpha ignava]|uniref:Two pore domain potassium channel family protein n=1 Tax=Cryomorpha ignava TaxID=101383 RepID=A0A7K3WQI0_9FLAO|nr:potassium channel family protein [Cryomorpha ignava]NEN23816.1 two pore domain potassium channel family protein [Cryomorpha ignava]